MIAGFIVLLFKADFAEHNDLSLIPVYYQTKGETRRKQLVFC